MEVTTKSRVETSTEGIDYTLKDEKTFNRELNYSLVLGDEETDKIKTVAPHMQHRFSINKNTVAITIPIVLTIMVAIGLSINSQYKNNSPVDYEYYPSLDTNRNSSCHTQYTILERVRVSVCWVYNGVAVDIREFVNKKPSIKGIQLTNLEWEDFMTYIGLIDYIVRNGPAI